ncbi:hypothetical protein GWR56_14070 [Mucilaginibacter sp. 14171R-50]|uniref:transaldolase family protein n=1 Tax=Mucilaginibacter sp. 14171R-50 TaxID=2703789 RepID=UPI00138CE89F|nr:hypothetical protein GWR56_14070 [Mucilaginibacter sp. 14171R-50]
MASFFLSRIDTLVDPLLEEVGLRELKGKVAVASAKIAYQIYKNAFHSKRFKNWKNLAGSLRNCCGRVRVRKNPHTVM